MQSMDSAASSNTVASTADSYSSALVEDVVNGLSCPQKQLPSKYFYDTEGSELFDQICELDEYYPYRTEVAMLPAIARDISHMLQGDVDVVEFGAGSLTKIRLLLKHIEGIRRFIPIDIAGEFLRREATALQSEFENIEVQPLEADFTRPVDLPAVDGAKPMGFFPGSTIGNFSPEFAQQFLSQARDTLGDGSLLLIGVDTKKAPATLHRAYNDRLGVTRKFNLNILTHLNRVAGADFDPQKFEHYAFYNPHKGCIEMHLVSQTAHTVTVNGDRFELREGESIHTENSHKYTPEEFLALAARSGWRSVRQWIAGENLFSVFLLKTNS